MKNIFLFIFLLPLLVLSQNPVNGKKFETQISASCDETNDGSGGMTYTYCVLKFEEQNVRVSYYTKGYEYNYQKHELAETKQFPYTIKGKEIRVDGFMHANLTIMTPDALFADQKKNPDQNKDLVFARVE